MRDYFRKGIAARAAWTPKPPTLKKPSLKGVIAVPIDDQGHWRMMSKAEAARQVGRSKGGTTTQARGTGHLWNSESARKAALKRWKRFPKRKTGVRRGIRLAVRPRVDRQALRDRYTHETRYGITYTPSTGQWRVAHTGCSESLQRIVSERTALVRLGHLRPRRKFQVPYISGV